MRRPGGACQRSRATSRAAANGGSPSTTAWASSHSNQADVGALARRWHRVVVGPEQEVAEVEVGVAEGGLVDVDAAPAPGPSGGCDRTRPVSSSASRRAACGRRLAGFDVAAGLHPAAQPPVAVAAPCPENPTTTPTRSRAPGRRARRTGGRGGPARPDSRPIEPGLALVGRSVALEDPTQLGRRARIATLGRRQRHGRIPTTATGAPRGRSGRRRNADRRPWARCARRARGARPLVVHAGPAVTTPVSTVTARPAMPTRPSPTVTSSRPPRRDSWPALSTRRPRRPAQ